MEKKTNKGYKWLNKNLESIKTQLVKANQLKRLEIESILLTKKNIYHEQAIITELNEILQDE